MIKLREQLLDDCIQHADKADLYGIANLYQDFAGDSRIAFPMSRLTPAMPVHGAV